MVSRILLSHFQANFSQGAQTTARAVRSQPASSNQLPARDVRKLRLSTAFCRLYRIYLKVPGGSAPRIADEQAEIMNVHCVQNETFSSFVMAHTLL